MNSSSIGIFDSGSGGLSIARAIRDLLPRESLMYIGDHVHAPYGDKSPEYIRDRALALTRMLIGYGCKLIVVACNTATIAGIRVVRETFPDVPIVGVVPVVKTAAAISKTKHFIVLSTHFTAKSHYQHALIRTFAGSCIVTSLGSSRLVPLIEKGNSAAAIREELHRVFDRVKSIPYDVVVLGCTHYPFIKEHIRGIVKDGVEVIDSGGAVARQVRRILIARDELSGGPPVTMYWTTGDAKKISDLFSQLLGQKIKVTHVTI